MKAPVKVSGGRTAFTLIELLMVLAIIGVLVSLLMAAVFKVTSKGDEATVRNDINQLSQGITNFMMKYSVTDPPPSRLVLSNKEADYFLKPGQLKPGVFTDSYEYLMRLWPRLNWNDSTSPIRWGGICDLGQAVELQGHECLVFFLGGIPTNVPTPGCTGFSTNPRNPTQPGGDRQSFYEFKPSRLVDPDVVEGTANGFFSYKDSFEKAPYAYFSSYKKQNRYNRYVIGPGSYSDCKNISNPAPDQQVWPYALVFGSSARYLNPDTFQIISAGQDGIFGVGSFPAAKPPLLWIPKQPMYAPGQPGYDDMANFHDKLLGIPD